MIKIFYEILFILFLQINNKNGDWGLGIGD